MKTKFRNWLASFFPLTNIPTRNPGTGSKPPIEISFLPLAPMSETDSQFVQARKFELEEIARIYGIPVNKP